MEGLVEGKSDRRFISMLADGLFHEKVPEGTEGAVLRQYELRDGTKGEKWERTYKRVENVLITNVEFETGDYGENLLVTLSDGDNEITIAQGVSTAFGEDMLKKLPALDFSKKLSVQPYAFEDEKGRSKRGVNFYQNGDKVMSHFWDGEKPVNGIPQPEGDTSSFSSDDWKLHFLQVRKFLVAYNKEHVTPKFAQEAEKGIEYPEEEVKAEDIPF